MSVIHVPRTRPGACVLLALALLPALARAQEPATARVAQETPNDAPAGRDPTRDELARRSRVDLHSGTPIELVGQAQGDESLRTRTPALLNFESRPRSVDEEQAYRRALALYGERASFTSPLPRATAAADRPAAARPPQVSPPAPPPRDFVVREKPAQPWFWLLAFGIAAVLIAWFLRRQQRAGDSEPQAAVG